jgi:hypothetical protein
VGQSRCDWGGTHHREERLTQPSPMDRKHFPDPHANQQRVLGVHQRRHGEVTVFPEEVQQIFDVLHPATLAIFAGHTTHSGIH